MNPETIHDYLHRFLQKAAFDIVLDLEKSNPSHLYDKKHDRYLLDMFTFFATMPLGMNHPKMFEPKFLDRLVKVALNKPSNTDFFTEELAEFVQTFERVALPDWGKYLFFIEGGALAVENALKIAFDWKVRKNFKKGYKTEKGHNVIHFQEAFHGRTGYTLSLTNTDPNKIQYFPKFNWIRIVNPKLKFPVNSEILEETKRIENIAIQQIQEAINQNKDDIACLIIEPIQGEGGDNHFRKEFFSRLREICDENEILLIFDEVQTGIGLTGKMWAYEHFVEPDIIAFGKKLQVGGVICNSRIDDVEENVFKKGGRINSTWGGNLTDMFRAKRFLEIIEEDNLIENANQMGNYLLTSLQKLQDDFSEFVSNARGLGLMCAIDLKDKSFRDELRKKLFENGMVILGCGEKSIRFRPRLSITKENIDEAMEIFRKSLKQII
ncbi:MAG: L-lysine 6-transaminase [Ignavibacteria bacterium]|jgi:L-lysine 6-transaminase|nr:L-lysine 6-transaminase [Ignavibacteria bacterium]MDH7527641.1 L-lysine 6-transaminase [Ignavibacteria bacterium]